jgi:excisionase family DNA binding protein
VEDATWYRTSEVAQLLGVTDRTVINWAQRGMLPHFTTPGGHRRFRAEDIEAFLTQRTS